MTLYAESGAALSWLVGEPATAPGSPSCPPSGEPEVDNASLSWITGYIWGIADDVLRDLYVRAGRQRLRADFELDSGRPRSDDRSRLYAV